MGLGKYKIAALLVLLSFSFVTPNFSAATDIITSSQSIKDPEAIVSAGNKFKLGFFSPANSTFRYVGLWNSDVPTTTHPMWVANRNRPINDASGVMRISDDGNLVVSNGRGEILWSSDVSGGVSNSSAQLKDDGNLVLRSNTTGSSSVWQSFQHPCDTILPNMKLSTNPRTGQLTSWKSPSDPSVGSFSCVIDPSGIAQYSILKENQTFWRSGPTDGKVFLGIPGMESVYLNGFSIMQEDDGSFSFRFAYANSSLVKLELSFDGKFSELTGNYGRDTWNYSWTVPNDVCGMYGKCGEFGICNPQNTPICSCLQGFEPKNLGEWNSGNWINGCVRKSLLLCEREQTSGKMGKIDGFLKMQRVKPPDYAEWSTASPEQRCRDVCLTDCSCIAYAYHTGFGCMPWTRNLTDIQQFSIEGVELNLRLAYSEFDGKTKNLKLIISLSVSIGAVTVVICLLFSIWLLAKQTGRKEENGQTLLSKHTVSRFPEEDMVGDDMCPGRLQEVPLFNLQNQKVLGARSRINQVELQELPVFNLQSLATATNNFSLSNKLGQGGFGPVYKGKLADGQEIAVKRLSRASGQGVEEFMNEVLVISKLQHRNLVRLLGCCVEGEEKMLVYEYMPNKSLDSFLFDPFRKEVLDWKKRSNIVEGICRGLLYLHRDSRLRIIHRDLKASNILLDKELNPKISDFGMARIFGGNEDQANTNRVVGTYGYMSPEYAMDGQFSEKSDVFSFGVLLLEIVCGRKNTSFYNESEMSLLGLAWRLWNEAVLSGLVDPTISDECFGDDIFRCIHVGLLCVQEFAKDRPSVSTIISMLNSEIVDLPTPKQPGFIGKLNGSDTESIHQEPKPDSIGIVTVENNNDVCDTK